MSQLCENEHAPFLDARVIDEHSKDTVNVVLGLDLNGAECTGMVVLNTVAGQCDTYSEDINQQ